MIEVKETHEQAIRGKALTNGVEGGWVATLSITVTLSAAEKKCLEAIAQLGSFSISVQGTYYPALDSLEEREFLTRERQGETLYRGRSRGDGFDVYHLTELAKRWLSDCRPAEEE